MPLAKMFVSLPRARNPYHPTVTVVDRGRIAGRGGEVESDRVFRISSRKLASSYRPRVAVHDAEDPRVVHSALPSVAAAELGFQLIADVRLWTCQSLAMHNAKVALED